MYVPFNLLAFTTTRAKLFSLLGRQFECGIHINSKIIAKFLE